MMTQADTPLLARSPPVVEPLPLQATSESFGVRSALLACVPATKTHSWEPPQNEHCVAMFSVRSIKSSSSTWQAASILCPLLGQMNRKPIAVHHAILSQTSRIRFQSL